MRSFVKIFMFFLFLGIFSLPAGTLTVNSSVRVYTCPCILEYQFPQFIHDFYKQVMGGIPVLRLSHAELEGNDMVCVYERRFASPENSSNGFAFIKTNGDPCTGLPTYLTMRIRNKASVIPGWQSEEQKIPRSQAQAYLVINPTSGNDEDLVSLCGVIFSREVQGDSNPELRRPKDGVTILNGDRTGFLCADKISDLTELAPAFSLETDEKKLKKIKPSKLIKKQKGQIDLRTAFVELSKKIKNKSIKDGLHTLHTSSSGTKMSVVVKNGKTGGLVATAKDGKRLKLRIIRKGEITSEYDWEDPDTGPDPPCPQGTELCVIVVEDPDTGNTEYYKWCRNVKN